MFSLICAWINGWVNKREVGDLIRYRAHYDIAVMPSSLRSGRRYVTPQSLFYVTYTNIRNVMSMAIEGIFFIYIWCSTSYIVMISYGRYSLGFCNNSEYAGFDWFLYLAFHSFEAPYEMEWCFHLCLFYTVTPCPMVPLCLIHTLPAHIRRTISGQLAKRYEYYFIWYGLTLQ